MTKKFCTFALDLPVPRDKMPVVADVVEAALVNYDSQLQPALVLADGKAVVLSYEQMRLIGNLFRDWTTMIAPPKSPLPERKYKIEKQAVPA